MRDITELINQEKPETKMTPDELAQKQYEADIARMRDFRTDEERMRWPKPIGPMWK